MTLFDGISARVIDTPAFASGILERDSDDATTPPERTVVLVHGNVSSALFWQEIMEDLPSDLRVIAVDLRGFGGSEHAPVDATRRLRDYSDDLHATLEALELETAALRGLVDGRRRRHAVRPRPPGAELTAPVAPSRRTASAGPVATGRVSRTTMRAAGGGGANPDFVERLAAGDTSDETQTSPRSVFRSGYVSAGYTTEHEDLWAESMLTTSTAEGNYPGDGVPSENWPGLAAGTIGVLNTMSPKYHDVSGIVDLEVKPPILWVHGSADPIVSDTSFYDLNYLGQLGIVPGWPRRTSRRPRRWRRRRATCWTRRRGGRTRHGGEPRGRRALPRTWSAPPSSATHSWR